MKISEQLFQFSEVHFWLVKEAMRVQWLPDPWRNQKMRELAQRSAQLQRERERFENKIGGML